ncbi:MAG TPA: hypothetical protein VMV57_04350, partial [Terracidiphilus sp.]|nr:hypothetical protein [Terracidiphilus sp.]
MAKEICISSTPHETRLAILEDDQLAEIYYERENEYTLAGSIYNGRVTRVLPGMQSAFVDIGLERDAFLYVTDFLELEDPEESDELEKAAVSGGSQPPREVVRQGGDRGGQRGTRQERGGRERRPAAEAAPESGEAMPIEAKPVEARPMQVQPLTAEFEQDDSQEGSDEPGAKRWRGRRRRRGGRGQAEPETTQPRTEQTSFVEEVGEAEPERTHQIHAGAAPHSRQERTAPAFVLPGEALSKYGGAPAEQAATTPAQQAAPTRSALTSRPSTLVEAPLSWDGSGMLPGESLTRHRNRAPEAEEAAETAPAEEFAEAKAATVHAGGLEIEEEETFEETTEKTSEAPAEAVESAEAEAVEGEEERNSEASHRVDPNPPTGFRLFGLGGKKHKDGEGEEPAKSGAPSSVSSVSAFAPGSGLVEEEVIEGEEYELSGHPHHRGDEHDLEEYEEETLQAQIRSGELGEMLQEAHLDHRIDMD